MKNKMLNSHCHGGEHRPVGGTHPSQPWSRHFLDSLWLLVRKIAFMCPTARSEHKLWRALMKAVDWLNSEGVN